MQRVIIFVGNSLFGSGVETLLRGEKGLEIVARETDAGRVIERVKELGPDVVIVDSAERACESMPLEMQILQEGARTSVIGLNLQDSTICVYHGERRLVTEVKDLVEAIEQCAAV